VLAVIVLPFAIRALRPVELTRMPHEAVRVPPLVCNVVPEVPRVSTQNGQFPKVASALAVILVEEMPSTLMK
jgi:hypothetical protein